ncbi:MAG: pilus assembly protein N-terminal domain-containing protein [Hyphomonadaceae bacterium]|nr:pilus assembly protein N-terminal domain-containing protein [Hyphomonadaceae bacterium]
MRAHSFKGRAAKFAVAVAGALALFAGVASANDIRVALDQSVPVRLAQPAEGVSIGNPSIAGVSVQNDRFLFVTGRAYGTTNLVVMGADNRVLYSGRVTVTPDETNVVMVTRGAQTARLECTPTCRPTPDIGDGQETFSAVSEQITGHAARASNAER